MKFIKISDGFHLNTAAIATLRFSTRDIIQTVLQRGRGVPTKTGTEPVAELVLFDGSKHTVKGSAVNALSQIVKKE
jgi:hypothetical protein